MKIRNGFVSNSSSSSFVCDVCGYTTSGWDGEYDIEISHCENGHEWCSSHKSKKMSLDDKRKMLLDDESWIKDMEKYSSIFNLEDIQDGDEDTIEDFFSEYCCDGLPEQVCPVCSLSSVGDAEMLKYLLKKHGCSRKSVEKEIKSKYKTLKDLKGDL